MLNFIEGGVCAAQGFQAAWVLTPTWIPAA